MIMQNGSHAAFTAVFLITTFPFGQPRAPRQYGVIADFPASLSSSAASATIRRKIPVTSGHVTSALCQCASRTALASGTAEVRYLREFAAELHPVSTTPWRIPWPQQNRLKSMVVSCGRGKHRGLIVSNARSVLFALVM